MNLEGKAVLVIDDSRFTRWTIRRELDKLGLKVLEAVDVRDARNVLAGTRPDLVILDLLLPEVNGMAVLEELHRQADPPPVVILTADIQVTTRERCLELGAKAFLKKPLNMEDLKTTLQGLLHG